MLTRVSLFLRAAPRVQLICRKGHGVPAHWKTPRQLSELNKSHMNFMPVPEGFWKEAYNKQNAKWNQMLAASILAVAVTAVVLWKTDSIYLHSAPPTKNCKK